MHQKLAPDPSLILLIQNSHCTQEILFKIRYFQRGYQKALKKLTLFFLLNPVPFNRQSYRKQKGPGTSDQSIFRSQKKVQKNPLFVIYYLTKFDEIM